MPYKPFQVGAVTTPPTGHQRSYPRGLESLVPVDQLLIQQEMDEAEATMGIEIPNKYKILTATGQQIFAAEERTMHQGGALRPFDIRITDGHNEVLRLKRPYRCDNCFCPCCLQKLTVTSPPKSVLGFVTQKWNLMGSKFIVENGHHDPQLLIKGPCCTSCSCRKNIDFKIYSLDGNSEVGAIQKEWTGFVQEAFSDADNFIVTFPRDLDSQTKAVLLGATFLIDFVYFEDAPAPQHRRRRGRRF